MGSKATAGMEGVAPALGSREAWKLRYAKVCRRYPDLVAVYEGRRRQLGLLLGYTITPLREERGTWFRRTRTAARPMIRGLRAAGFRGRIVVLQWCSGARLNAVFRTWTCCYESDPVRRAALVDIAARACPDQGAADSRQASSSRPTLQWPANDTRSLADWYQAMTPSWMAAGPIVRRLLVLATHRFILEQDLATMTDAAAIGCALAPDGSLARRLAAFVPADEAARWRRWIGLVVGDLRSALARPADRRDAAWRRWLFLIPYSVPTPALRQPDARPAPKALSPAAGGS